MRPIYTCYIIITPEEDIWGGVTSLKPHKRWNYGNGFLSTPLLGDSIRKWGWEKMKPIVIGQYKTKLEASQVMEGVRRAAEGHWKGRKWDVLPLPLSFTPETLFGFKPYRSVVKEEHSKQHTMEQIKKITPLAIRKTAGVKLSLTLDTRYIRQTGLYPVVVKLYHKGRYAYLQTGFSSTPSTFPSFLPEEELQLQEIFNGVCLQINTQSRKGWVDINALGKQPSLCLSLTGIMEEKCKLLDNPSTIHTYESAAKVIKMVWKDGLRTENISSDTIQKVITYMESQSYSPTTINFYMTSIKSAINYGIYKGYLKEEQYPFMRNQWEVDKARIPQGRKRDENYFTLPQMQSAWSYFLETGDVWVGAFLFSYLHGGMNVADMMNLEYNDFFFKEGGFRYRRIKTQGKVESWVMVPVTKYTLAILDRLGWKPEKGEKVWKVFTQGVKDWYCRKANVSTYINNRLKKMCKDLDFPSQCSMTTARHSFATIATRQGLPYTMVEEAMGHKLAGVSSHYIGKWRVEEMKEWMEKLL